MKKLDVFQTYSSFVSKLVLSVTLLALVGNNAFAQSSSYDCQLNCNDDVQVSLNNDCKAIITYDVMLEDPDNPALCKPNGPSAYVVQVMDHWGNEVGSNGKITRTDLANADGYCGVK
ncbi:MAG: hypothetical protein KJP00_14535, partial [Bacteroidia bacterium]|nr:hypothetical protein [Bacteroidia bacterium]